MAAPHQPEHETEKLDSFLAGERLHRLTGVDRRRAMRDLFAAEPQERADPFDPATKPQRIMVMWRLVRTTAMVKGLLAEDETLDAGTEFDPDPWTTPFKPNVTPSQGAALRRARIAQLGRIHMEGEGLPLLPPRNDEGALTRWCDANALIAADLAVERSREGLLGLQGLLDPTQCARCDVRSGEVIAFEEMLIEEALELLLDAGERAAIKHFRDRYGFSLKETKGLIRLVKATAVDAAAASTEEKRALAEMRLEDQLGRYKESMDMDGELKAIKELARIQGLTRTEPENQAVDFADVVKRVSSRQDREVLDPDTLRLLDGNRAEEVEAITLAPIEVEADPDDEQALAEYDAENQHR
jgi:hypothetical protein